MTASRPDSWRLVKSERGSLPDSVVDFRDGSDELTGERAVPRLALFHQNPEVIRSFDSLAASGALEFAAFSFDAFAGVGDVGKKVRHSWKKGKGFDAVVVEASADPECYKRLMAWLRRTIPDTPILGYGAPGPGREQGGITLYLTQTPTAESLATLLYDAKRHHRLARNSSLTARRLRDTSRRLEILSEIVATANSVLEPRHVVSVIMSHIQKLIPSEAWSILLVDEKKRELTFELALGEKGEDFSDIRLKIGEGIAGWVAETGEPAIVNDAMNDPRFQRRYDKQTHFQTRSILCAPLVSRGSTIGVVEIMNRASGSRFTRQDLNLLMTLVEPAAIALENAFLFQKTEKLAITDDLTKLYNSHYLGICLGHEIDRATEQRTSLAVIFLDLDGFKGVNDTHGHLCGSRTLFEVGDILRRSVREEDILARYGGDEFVVVLPHTDGKGALSIAQRIRGALKEHAFLREFDLAVHLSASFGISSFPEHGGTPQDLIQKADQAMYSVKESGKDAVAVAGT
ncbi:MAG: sensor domain-containing diguanylate cyclase [Vicinamibacteria bacterium]